MKMGTFTVASVIALAWTSSSQAQVVNNEEVAEAQADIVVTARKKEESLQDVPVSIAVTSGKAIQDQGFASVQDLSQSIPAVNISLGGGSDSLFVRGVGSGFNAAFEQSVGFIMDGVSIGRSRATQAAFLDLERVEVLKGPQPTYFGANTIAGAINVTSKSPSLSAGYEGFLLSSYEFETDEASIEGAINAPISDTLGVRVAGKYSDSKGYL